MHNLRGAVELLAGASTSCRMVLLHHGHRLRVHRLPHRARSDQNPPEETLKCRSDERAGVTHQCLEVERALRGDLLARLQRQQAQISSGERGQAGERSERGYLEEVGVRGVGEEGRVGGEVVPLELLHQVRHLRRRRREGRCRGGLRHRGRRRRWSRRVGYEVSV